MLQLLLWKINNNFKIIFSASEKFFEEKNYLKAIKKYSEVIVLNKKKQIFTAKEVNVMQNYQCGLNLLKILK
jgi:hypothetical protein